MYNMCYLTGSASINHRGFFCSVCITYQIAQQYSVFRNVLVLLRNRKIILSVQYVLSVMTFGKR